MNQRSFRAFQVSPSWRFLLFIWMASLFSFSSCMIAATFSQTASPSLVSHDSLCCWYHDHDTAKYTPIFKRTGFALTISCSVAGMCAPYHFVCVCVWAYEPMVMKWQCVQFSCEKLLNQCETVASESLLSCSISKYESVSWPQLCNTDCIKAWTYIFKA